jgi:hypothetical protein
MPYNLLSMTQNSHVNDLTRRRGPAAISGARTRRTSAVAQFAMSPIEGSDRPAPRPSEFLALAVVSTAVAPVPTVRNPGLRPAH